MKKVFIMTMFFWTDETFCGAFLKSKTGNAKCTSQCQILFGAFAHVVRAEAISIMRLFQTNESATMGLIEPLDHEYP